MIEINTIESIGDEKLPFYEKIKKLSDEDLIDSVENPLNGQYVKRNTI